MGIATSFVVKWALTDLIVKYIFIPIFGLLYAPFVVVGERYMLNMVMIKNTTTIRCSLFFPILAISNIAHCAAALVFTLDHKKSEKMKQVGYPVTIAAWLDVTKAAMYGINMRYFTHSLQGLLVRMLVH